MADVTRRSVVRAGAWSAPVVALSVAAPAFAASAQKLTWTWTADYVRSYQALTYLTVTNPAAVPVDVTFEAPRFQGSIELYGYGFGPWTVSLSSTRITCTATVPAGSSHTTPFLGYYTRVPPTSDVLLGTLSPAADPQVPFLSLDFT
ncbi:hypothetical protein [Nocardioides alkalitolerans]|uniref:hypothetical protein n=1 Tax=Nocardioides alkalitolerans TaxID=281714 RepID=UPI0012FAE3E0|nr:hypothetical protein [Nocardioides alkalitolerans]